jgi:hypothetical protein
MVLAYLHPAEGGFKLESEREAAIRLNGARVLNSASMPSPMTPILRAEGPAGRL